MKNFSQVNSMNGNKGPGIVGEIAEVLGILNHNGEPNFGALVECIEDLERRAFNAWHRGLLIKSEYQFLDFEFSGFEVFDGLPYVVLRGRKGIVAVYRVRMKCGQASLRRVTRNPRGIDAKGRRMDARIQRIEVDIKAVEIDLTNLRAMKGFLEIASR